MDQISFILIENQFTNVTTKLFSRIAKGGHHYKIKNWLAKK